MNLVERFVMVEHKLISIMQYSIVGFYVPPNTL